MAEGGIVSVFFNNVPVEVKERDLRSLFEQTGNVTGLRLLHGQKVQPGPGGGTVSNYGFVDFVDVSAAREAVQKFNGYVLRGMPMKCQLAKNKKRGRDEEGGQQDETDGEMCLGFGEIDPMSAALTNMPVSEAYEAVEQLRLIALERPDECIGLFEATPQLRAAVVMILQHAGKLPQTSLMPQEAYEVHGLPINAPEAQSPQRNSAGSPSGVDDGVQLGDAAGGSAIPRYSREEAMAKIAEMDESRIEMIGAMSDAEIDALAEMVELRRHIKEMLS